MTSFDDTERRLRAWLTDEGQVGDTTQLFDAIADGSRLVRQRPGLIVRLRSGGMGGSPSRVLGSAGTRRLATLALVALLVALLAAAAILVGSQLLTPSPNPLIPPDRGFFTPTGSMTVPRYLFTATTLRDGRVLVVGGFHDVRLQSSPGTGLAEIWDPDTGSFSPAGTLITERWAQTATLLPDGRVLVVGGIGHDPRINSDDALASAEIWDPATDSFSATGSLAVARSDATVRVLSDGRVLVAGGNAGGDGGAVTSAEVWDPVNGLVQPGRIAPRGGVSRGHATGRWPHPHPQRPGHKPRWSNAGVGSSQPSVDADGPAGAGPRRIQRDAPVRRPGPDRRWRGWSIRRVRQQSPARGDMR